MQYVPLGRTALKVSRLCVGTMNLGESVEEDESRRILDAALDLDFNFLDTANIYGGMVEGTNYFSHKTEEILGRWFAAGKGRREKVVLATKMMGPCGPGPNDGGLSACHIRRACEDSLRRLQTDHIDLNQIHGFAPDTPVDELWEAMETLIRQGKILYVGSSNCPSWYITKATIVSRFRNGLGFVSEQCRYNLSWRLPELEVLPAARDLGIGILPYSPLGSGLLAGDILDKPATGRRSSSLMQHVAGQNRERIERYETLCRELGESAAVVALAWLLAQPGVTSPVLGPRTVDQLTGTVRALDLHLDADTRKHLEVIWPRYGATG